MTKITESLLLITSFSNLRGHIMSFDHGFINVIVVF